MRPYLPGLMMPPNFDNVASEHRSTAKSVVSAILEDPYNGYRVHDHVGDNLYALVRLDLRIVLLVGYLVDLEPRRVEFPFIGSFLVDPDINYFDMHLRVRKLLQKVSRNVGAQLFE